MLNSREDTSFKLLGWPHQYSIPTNGRHVTTLCITELVTGTDREPKLGTIFDRPAKDAIYQLPNLTDSEECLMDLYTILANARAPPETFDKITSVFQKGVGCGAFSQDKKIPSQQVC